MRPDFSLNSPNLTACERGREVGRGPARARAGARPPSPPRPLLSPRSRAGARRATQTRSPCRRRPVGERGRGAPRWGVVLKRPLPHPPFPHSSPTFCMAAATVCSAVAMSDRRGERAGGGGRARLQDGRGLARGDTRSLPPPAGGQLRSTRVHPDQRAPSPPSSRRRSTRAHFAAHPYHTWATRAGAGATVGRRAMQKRGRDRGRRVA
jgi:hypothetical protein